MQTLARLYLYSPLPRLPTGTADYLANVLAELTRCWGAGIEDRVLLVDDLVANRDLDDSLRSRWSVIDIREARPRGPDACVYFLAANAFHGFTWRALVRHRVGRCFALIHDLSSISLLRGLAL